MEFKVKTFSNLGERIAAFAKRNPLLVGGGVLAGAAGVVLLIRRAGSGGLSTVTEGEAPAPGAEVPTEEAPTEESILDDLLRERLAALEKRVAGVQEEVTRSVSESLGRELAGWASSLPAVEPVASKTVLPGESVVTAALGGVSDVDILSTRPDQSIPATASVAVPVVGTKSSGPARTSSASSKRYEIVEDDRGIGSVVEAPSTPAVPSSLPAARADVYLGEKATSEMKPSTPLPAARADVYLGQKATDEKPAPAPAARADVYLGQKAVDQKKVETPAGGLAKRSRIGGTV